MIDDPSTINGWIRKPGPINLRVSKPRRDRDLNAASGIALACAIGVAVMAWTVVLMEIIWWLWR